MPYLVVPGECDKTCGSRAGALSSGEAVQTHFSLRLAAGESCTLLLIRLL